MSSGSSSDLISTAPLVGHELLFAMTGSLWTTSVGQRTSESYNYIDSRMIPIDRFEIASFWSCIEAYTIVLACRQRCFKQLKITFVIFNY